MTDANVIDPSKPCVALPRFEIVPCWFCLYVFGLGDPKNREAPCALCGSTHYVRVDPEKVPIYEPGVPAKGGQS